MKQILDLHIHSRFARACSSELTLKNIDRAARIKGLDIVATGDFTHPQWFLDIKRELVETFPGSGLYRHREAVDDKLKFTIATELSLVYKDGLRARRIHLLVNAPNLEAAEELRTELDKGFNLKSDGRPILGMSAPKLVDLCLKIHPDFLIYPAHIWTPWYAVFGSKSGFDSLLDCFQEQTKNIYAYETGLSSDPEMNWRVSQLDNLTCLSSSDAHSLGNLGREATIMDLEEITYSEIYNIIKKRDLKKLLGTIEFYPEEGMYHFDGHRLCSFSSEPETTKKLHKICPICKKELVIGVLYRVDELADRSLGYIPDNMAPFKKIVGLKKIIAEALGVTGLNTLKVNKEYNDLILKFGSELKILLDLDLDQVGDRLDKRIIDGLNRMRSGNLIIKPGFDGQYGQVNIFADDHQIIQSKLI